MQGPLLEMALYQGGFGWNYADDNWAHVDVLVHMNCKMKAMFTLLGRSYEFNLTKWSGNGRLSFLQLFLTHYTSPSMNCGSIQDNEEGFPVVSATKEQWVNVMKKAVVDVFACLSKLIQYAGRSIIDYAAGFV